MLASSHPQAVSTAAIVASHATRSVADASDNSIPIANGTSANGLSGCGNGTYSTSCCASLSMLVSPAKSPVRIWPENLAGFRICAGCAEVGTVNHLDYLCIYRRSGEVSSGSALLPSRQSTLARAGAATNGLFVRGPCQFRRCQSSRGTSTPICCRFGDRKAAGIKPDVVESGTDRATLAGPRENRQLSEALCLALRTSDYGLVSWRRSLVDSRPSARAWT